MNKPIVIIKNKYRISLKSKKVNIKKNMLLTAMACCLLSTSSLFSQSVGINTDASAPHPSAILDVKSTGKGLLVPRMSTAERNAIATPAKGLLLFDNNTSSFWFYNGGAWTEFSAGSTGWGLAGNAGTNPATQFIGTVDSMRLNFKVYNQKAGSITPTGETFFGFQAGNSNTSTTNSGFGYQSLFSNTTGYNNTANGDRSLLNNTTGHSNVAIGTSALYQNTARSNLVAVGDSALYNNGLGATFSFYSVDNTAVGSKALYSNNRGVSNTGIGVRSLYNNTTGGYNSANGGRSLYNNTTGSYNTANGFNSLNTNSTGDYNTANGYRSLFSNSTGIENTANGVYALFSNTTGNYNTANGVYSLYFNTEGINNTANGYMSLFLNNTGSENTANGVSSLHSNTGGNYNTATGTNSLYSNIGGGQNAAHGNNSLYSNTNGIFNTANGNSSLYSNTTGGYNTACGFHSLYYNTTGNYNTAVGYDAFGSGDYYNSTAIGYNTQVFGSNMVRIGDAYINSIGGIVDWTTLSDARFKTNVQETVPGLNFILKLRPVTYNLNQQAINALLKTPDSLRNKEQELTKTNTLQTGFIAQEVETVAKSMGYQFSGVDAPKNENDYYGLRYAEFTVPLVKAVQEQQKIIENQNKQIEQQQQQYEALLKRVAVLEKKN
jgi:trimeric autotransporter adhesin